MKSFYLLFGLLIISSSKEIGSPLKHKGSFIPETYAYCMNNDCDTSAYQSTATFRRHLQKGLPCNGQYCIDNQWSCKGALAGACYQVEHIIDNKGQEFKECPRCKNIPGNYVMAYGSWNQELGNLGQISYDAMIEEKVKVYGQCLMDKARDAIKTCIKNHPSECSKTRAVTEITAYEPSQIIIDSGIDFIYYGPINQTEDCNCSDPDRDCDQCDYIELYLDDHPNLTILMITLISTICVMSVIISTLCMLLFIYVKKIKMTPAKMIHLDEINLIPS